MNGQELKEPAKPENITERENFNVSKSSPNRKAKGKWFAWFMFLLALVLVLLILVSITIVNSPKRLSVEDIENLIDYAVDEVAGEIIQQNIVDPPIDYETPLMKQRKIIIMGEINGKSSKEICSRLLHLDKVNPTEPIDLYIWTNGGNVTAFAVGDVINLIKAPVNTWCLGDCASAGALILAAGSGRRYMLDNSTMSIHIVEEKGEEKYSEELTDRIRQEKFWKTHAKLPSSFYPMDHEKSYHLSSEQALEYGIIDEIIPRKTGNQRKKHDQVGAPQPIK